MKLFKKSFTIFFLLATCCGLGSRELGLNAFSSDLALKYPPSTSPTKRPTTTHDVKPAITNIIFQSKDGGQTWQDIGLGLPENEQPEDFFAGESDVYLRVKSVMYRSKSELKTPVWEKENVPSSRITSIAFNRSGVMAFTYEGQIYRKIPVSGTWSPVYTNFKEGSMRSVFETSDGTVFLGCDNGLYKSADKGQIWKRVQDEGWVMDMVESEGVLIGTGQKGIMRSTDNGEHWEWVISEGGVGIAIEHIEGGFAAISYNTRTLSRRIHISLDNGKTWNAISEGLEPSFNISSVKGLQASASISSIKQMGGYLICGHPNGIYRSSDMGKTWNIVRSGVDNKVFKIYASGTTLYAVLMNAGC